MDIEPHHITTVSRRPLVGSDAPRTLAEYQAPIIAKYGYLPSWPELAKHEGPRIYVRYDYTPPSDLVGREAAIAAIIAKGEATRASILGTLTKPMTCPDVANALGRTRRLINRHLVLLAKAGKITGQNVKGLKVWERISEAAE